MTFKALKNRKQCRFFWAPSGIEIITSLGIYNLQVLSSFSGHKNHFQQYYKYIFDLQMQLSERQIVQHLFALAAIV